MMPGVNMAHPEDVALIRGKPRKGDLLKGVHDLFFLFRRNLVVGMPRESTRGELPPPLNAVDEGTGHGNITAQHLRGTFLSARRFQMHKVAGRLVAFACAVREDFHQHGSSSASSSMLVGSANSAMRRSMAASAVSTSTASTARL